MQELLTKTDVLIVPLRDQQFYELRLDDSDDISRPGHIVRQSHAMWSEIDCQIVWDDFEIERCSTLEEAKARYAARRRDLVQKGFIYSDMDLF